MRLRFKATHLRLVAVWPPNFDFAAVQLWNFPGEIVEARNRVGFSPKKWDLSKTFDPAIIGMYLSTSFLGDVSPKNGFEMG